MKTHVEFRSDKFPPYPEEEEQINPGRHGKRLAEFLSTGLRAQGVDTGELVAEDWGWIVPIKNNEFELWIGCGNYDEYPDGFLCFIETDEPSLELTERLQNAMDKVLSGPGIQEKHWLTEEEFNGGQ